MSITKSDDLSMLQTVICSSHIHCFLQTFCVCPIQTAKTLVDIKSYGILVYAHICACTDKTAKMYFGSINYASVRPDQSLLYAWCS